MIWLVNVCLHNNLRIRKSFKTDHDSLYWSVSCSKDIKVTTIGILIDISAELLYWMKRNGADQITLKTRQSGIVVLMLPFVCCLEIRFLSFRALWRLAKERCVKPADFLFYLWTTKSIAVSAAPAALPRAPRRHPLRCPFHSPISLFRPTYFRGEWCSGWRSAPQCLRGEK